MTIAIGFNIFLERLLPHSGIKEKGSMVASPRVQLGGGAYNVAKTLLSLGVATRAVSLLGTVGAVHDIDRRSVEQLAAGERFPIMLLPVRARTSTSYYLIPPKGRTWGIGDGGGPFRSDAVRRWQKAVVAKGRSAKIKIAMEVSADPQGIALAKKFLEKIASHQKSVCVPSARLLRQGGIAPLLKITDLLAFNEDEGRIFWKKPPTKADLLRTQVPAILLTRGEKGAWLKVQDKIYDAKPSRILKNPPYVGGAGDATVAAFVLSFFCRKEPPEKALSFAMDIGTRTLLLPTSYFTRKP